MKNVSGYVMTNAYMVYPHCLCGILLKCLNLLNSGRDDYYIRMKQPVL